MKKIILTIFAIFILTFANIVSAGKYDYLNVNNKFSTENTKKEWYNYGFNLQLKYWDKSQEIYNRIEAKTISMDEATLVSYSNILEKILKNYNWEHKIVLEIFKYVIDLRLFTDFNK